MLLDYNQLMNMQSTIVLTVIEFTITSNRTLAEKYRLLGDWQASYVELKTLEIDWKWASESQIWEADK